MHGLEYTLYKVGMLIENRKSGFRFQNRNPVFGFENRFSNLFVKVIFRIKYLLIAEKNNCKI